MRVLVIDDDQGIRWVLTRVLKEEGVEAIQADSMAAARILLQQKKPIDLIFLDVYLPDGNGMEALQQGLFATTPVVLLTAESTFDNAAQAYKAGALEYLPKPFDLDEVRSLVARVRPKPQKEGAKPKRETGGDGLIIGRSPAMQHLFRTLGRVAASDLSVLITGESGSGKDLVARVLHEQSSRAGGPFVPINTAAIPHELLEAELFGHERGAFTGADRARAGRFEQADGGTLFLDEIGDMPMALQVKLLRVLEEGVVRRVGGRDAKPVNVRLVAATHQDLPDKISEGKFREDLFYRLNVIPVHIPPLRERRDDVADLAHFLLQSAANELHIKPPVLLDDAVELLSRHDWPGNVRELKNVMRRLAALTPGAAITVSDVALALGNRGSQKQEETLSEAVSRCIALYLNQLGYAEVQYLYEHLLQEVEPPLLRLALNRCGGNQIRAAQMLGLNRNTLRKLLTKYEIDAQEFKE